MDLTIWHDGANWIVKNEHLRVSAPTLEDLDRKVGESMEQMGIIGKGEKKKVIMRFAIETIPQWVRQYAQHYFNRIVEIKG